MADNEHEELIDYDEEEVRQMNEGAETTDAMQYKQRAQTSQVVKVHHNGHAARFHRTRLHSIGGKKIQPLDHSID